MPQGSASGRRRVARAALAVRRWLDTEVMTAWNPRVVLLLLRGDRDGGYPPPRREREDRSQPGRQVPVNELLQAKHIVAED